ncbi:MAG: hypothetical protein LKJ17_07015 [Oscillospiraceae bacterium]|jgi:Fe-S-cluster-containing dehydrogenase component|nr:hypothetical protein [Oscillospiraceae bacterium]
MLGDGQKLTIKVAIRRARENGTEAEEQMTHSEAPCFQCRDRKLHCRKSCRAWNRWQENEKHFKAIVQKERQKDNSIRSIYADRSARNLRRAVHDRARGRRAY